MGGERAKPGRAASLASRVWIVVVLLVVPPVAAFVVVLATERTADAARRAVDAMVEARLDLEQLRTAMVDQETGLRGYLLSGDPSFLRPYDEGRTRADAELSSLEPVATGRLDLRGSLDQVAAAKRGWEGLADAAQADPASIGVVELQRRADAFEGLRSSLDGLESTVERNAAATRHDLVQARDRRRLLLRVATIACIASAVVGGSALVRWLRRSISALGGALERAAEEPGATLPPGGPAELAMLASRVEALRFSVLEESDRRLRRGLVEAQEAERRRVAGEIHDDVIQSLTALGLRLGMLESTVTQDDAVNVAAARAAATAAMERLRSMVFDLYPPALDRHGLVAALETCAADHRSRTSARIEVAGDEGDCQVATQAVAYRAARELLTNSVQHASATSITVTVSPRDHGLAVAISDDGVGFDPWSLAEVPGHVGLPTARAVVHAAAGRWALEAAPGAGTRVELWIPDVVEAHPSGAPGPEEDGAVASGR